MRCQFLVEGRRGGLDLRQRIRALAQLGDLLGQGLRCRRQLGRIDEQARGAVGGLELRLGADGGGIGGERRLLRRGQLQLRLDRGQPGVGLSILHRSRGVAQGSGVALRGNGVNRQQHGGRGDDHHAHARSPPCLPS